MLLFIDRAGNVKAAMCEADLKTHFKWAGYEGQAIEVAGSPVDLAKFKPKPATPLSGAPSQNAEVAQLLEANKAQAAQIAQLIAALQKPAEAPKA